MQSADDSKTQDNF